MVRYGDPVVGWSVGLKYEVATSLVHNSVVEIPDQHLREGGAAKVPWDSRAKVNISSRTKWGPTRRGGGESKWYALTASRTFSRSSSHVSGSVKMSSVKPCATKPPSASWMTSKTSSSCAADRHVD